MAKFEFRFGLDTIPYITPTSAGRLPLIPLNVRVFVPADDVANPPSVEDELRCFQDARLFWQEKASIELRLIKGKVEIVSDPDGSLSNPSSSRYPLDALHVPGQSWLSVVYVQDSWNSAQAHFSRGTSESPGSGVVAVERSGAVLAHEIGHYLGLPHTPDGVDDRRIAFATACLLPFVNDTALLHWDDEVRNLMQNGLWGAPRLREQWLSKSQVERARLTIVSRQCPYSRIYEGRRPEDSVDPLLDDISAAFVAEAFPIERPFADIFPRGGDA